MYINGRASDVSPDALSAYAANDSEIQVGILIQFTNSTSPGILSLYRMSSEISVLDCLRGYLTLDRYRGAAICAHCNRTAGMQPSSYRTATAE